MNRFFRSALFPFLLIAVLAYLLYQVLGHGRQPQAKNTSEVITWIQQYTGRTDSDIQGAVTIDPTHQSLTLTHEGQLYSVNYASPQSEAAIEQLMRQKGVPFTSKGIGGFSWIS